MKFNQEGLWAGTEQSYQAAVEANNGIKARIAAGDYGGGEDDSEEEDKPRLLEVNDGVGVISISGSLTNNDSWLNQYFGITSYGEIRDAVISAAYDPEVKQILLDVSSGGGAVSGVEDTARLIRTINDQVKPVAAYVEGIGASAAYWLACSSGSVYAGKTAVVGSIGVISTHKEYSKYFAEQGIGVNVIRAGKEKALANANEPLSEKGRQQIQQVVDAVYEVFVDHVANMRGKSYDYTDKNMADGKEFVGQSAVDVGLIDGITTFDALMSDLKEKSIDASKNSMDNRLNPNAGVVMRGESNLSGEPSMKKALTEQDVAAIAAGAVVIAADAANPVADGAAEGAPAEAAVEEGAAPEAAANPGSDAPVAQNLDTSAATIQLLNEQLAAKDSALIEANVKLAKLNDQVQEAAATHGPLMEIACKSINNMQIALGGSALDLSGMTAVAVLAEHKRLTGVFADKFKAGGVAAVSAKEASAEAPAPVLDAITMARLNAVRPNK